MAEGAPTVPDRFVALVAQITGTVQGAAVEPALAGVLARDFPPDGPVFQELSALCRQGIADGWLCAREQGGIKFGRPVKPGPATHGFSIDVVEMDAVVGPHHRHPHGEIDMVMPVDAAARFDGTAQGWKVYAPDSAHNPTVTDGKAVILYLLPQGAIQFTGA
jgi:hypothetical protein